MFATTSEKRDDGDKPAGVSAAREGSEEKEAPKRDSSSPEESPSDSPVVYEKDILEEDVDDSEYIPYQKRSKAKKVVAAATGGAAAGGASSSSSSPSEQPQPIKKALRSSRKSSS